MVIEGKTYKEGDAITLNGTRGYVYAGTLDMIDATENPRFQQFMKLVDKYRTMGVRTNADTPEDAQVARDFGAEGIGLFRTEHMFYGIGAEEPLFVLRKMIHAESDAERNAAMSRAWLLAASAMTAPVFDGLRHATHPPFCGCTPIRPRSRRRLHSLPDYGIVRPR